MGMKLALEVIVVVGWLACVGGLAGYDWRLALIVAGGSASGVAFRGLVIAEKRPRKNLPGGYRDVA
jgi:hypothetical protein